MDIPKLFGESDKPTPRAIADAYQVGLSFNEQIQLEEQVEDNQNFYIGKQWEGVNAQGLPKPVFNFIKKTVGHTIASTTSDNIHVQASQLQAVPENNGSLYEPVQISNDIFESITERCNIVYKIRRMVQDAAINGDGCLHVYWDDSVETEEGRIGDVQVELVENTRVFFGDPQNQDIEDQPFVIIAKRELIRNVKKRMKANGKGKDEMDKVRPDSDRRQNSTPASMWNTDNKVTVFRVYYKDDETDTIWGYECTEEAEIKEPTDLDIRLYPIVWFSWDRIRDSYHGQSYVSGLIPNQMFVNKLGAMIMLSATRSGFSKTIYDATKIPHWNNSVGTAIPVNGGDVRNVAMNIDPAPINPQISNLFQMFIEVTETMMGQTKASTGEAAAYNTSALVTQQRASQAPHEIQKQFIYIAVENLYRIFLEFMGGYYGTRMTNSPPTKEVVQMYQMAMIPVPDTVPIKFDFEFFRNHPCKLKLDVGASSYYSEIQSIETLSMLLQSGAINVLQFLKRIPDGTVQDRRGLIRELEGIMNQMRGGAMPTDGSMPTRNIMDMMAQATQQRPSNQASKPEQPQNPDDIEVQGGKGNGALQRAINASAGK